MMNNEDNLTPQERHERNKKIAIRSQMWERDPAFVRSFNKGKERGWPDLAAFTKARRRKARFLRDRKPGQIGERKPAIFFVAAAMSRGKGMMYPLVGLGVFTHAMMNNWYLPQWINPDPKLRRFAYLPMVHKDIPPPSISLIDRIDTSVLIVLAVSVIFFVLWFKARKAKKLVLAAAAIAAYEEEQDRLDKEEERAILKESKSNVGNVHSQDNSTTNTV